MSFCCALMFMVLRSPRTSISLNVLDRRSFAGSTLSREAKPPGPMVQLKSYLTPKSRALPVCKPLSASLWNLKAGRSSPASESLLILPLLNRLILGLLLLNWLSWLIFVKVDFADLRLLCTANFEAVSDYSSIISL